MDVFRWNNWGQLYSQVHGGCDAPELSDVGPYFHFRSGCACLCMFGQCSTYCWRRTVCVCICLVKAVHAVSGSACLGEAVHAWSCLIVFGCVWLCLVSSGQGCVPLTRSVVCLLD